MRWFGVFFIFLYSVCFAQTPTQVSAKNDTPTASPIQTERTKPTALSSAAEKKEDAAINKAEPEASSKTNEKFYVVSKNAKLKAEPSASSKTIAQLKIGTSLFLRTKQEKWYLVFTADGDNGWIYRGKVSSKAPGNDGEKNDEFFVLEYEETSISGEKMYTARSIRGAKQNPEAAGPGISDIACAYAELVGFEEDEVLSLSSTLMNRPSDTDIETFLRQGGIGEYSE